MDEPIHAEKLLTAEQVAEPWGVSPSLLRNPAWRQRHGLVAIRIGRLLRFSASDVSNFVARHMERKDSIATV
jgi:hypothetical protein